MVTLLSIAGVGLLKIVNKDYVFCILNTEAITFSREEMTLDSLVASQERYFGWIIVCLSWHQTNEGNIYSGLGNILGN